MIALGITVGLIHFNLIESFNWQTAMNVAQHQTSSTTFHCVSIDFMGFFGQKHSRFIYLCVCVCLCGTTAKQQARVLMTKRF